MTRRLLNRFVLTGLFVAVASAASAQRFDERFDDWPVDLRIRGTVVVAAELEDVGILKDAIGRRATKSGRKLVLVDGTADGSAAPKYAAGFQAQDDGTVKEPIAQVTVVKSAEDFADQLTSALDQADVCCWHTPAKLSTTQLNALNKTRDAVAKYVDNGRTFVAVGSMASVSGKAYFGAEANELHVQGGLNLLPDCVIATDYDRSETDRGRLLAALALRPRSVGIGIEKNTAIVLSGRLIRVVGSGTATFVLMANERLPIRSQTIAARKSASQPPEEYLIDLTQWRREAIDRTLEAFPPQSPGKPFVENGTLVIVGGGGMPRGLMRRFVDLAGGKEKARLVYVPCAEEDDVGERQGMVEEWKRMGVEHATFIHTKDRRRANEDSFAAPLKDATGIWFGGGRQWNLADSYYGTTAHRLMKEVLHRGGVIGGSSAGASIQGRYLARATPIDNMQIMAPGYERGGLGFLDGVAIDQHFSQRGRQKDMTQLTAKYPQLLGIGLDEATAIVVQKSIAEVVGNGKVYFYDRRLPQYPDRPDYVAVASGGRFELVERKVIEKGNTMNGAPAPSATEPK